MKQKIPMYDFVRFLFIAQALYFSEYQHKCAISFIQQCIVTVFHSVKEYYFFTLLSCLFIHDRPKSGKVPAQKHIQQILFNINIDQNSSISGPRREKKLNLNV